MSEIWKDIPDYEGFYQISSIGVVRSIPRLIKNSTGTGFRRVRSRIMSQRGGPKWYCLVCLSKDGKTVSVSVHILLWISFKGLIPKGKEINHINGIKSDNRLENLEVVTHKENIHHAIRTGLWTPNPNPSKGSHNGGAKLGEDQILEMRSKYTGIYGQIAALGREYGITDVMAGLILKRKSWVHI